MQIISKLSDKIQITAAKYLDKVIFLHALFSKLF
jgi:hypothetical protein